MFPRHAHSAIICGATGCGKTEFALDLLEMEYKGFFEYIVIVCPTWMYNKAYLNRAWFFKDSNVIPMDSSWCPRSDDWLNDCLTFGYETFGIQDGHTLFIIFSAFSGRHKNCSLWVLTQKYNSVLTDLREQTKWTALFYTKDRDSFEDTMKENDVVPSLEERKRIREKLAKHKHSKLILITEQPTSYRFER